jgi:hypothetical protein
MAYESAYERFQARAPDGRVWRVEFRRAGLLAAGDHPELYFFSVDGEEAVVGLSGAALRSWQGARRYLSREEKVDVAGLLLKRRIEEGAPLSSASLYVRESDLSALLADLGILP